MSAGNINRELSPVPGGFGQLNLTAASQDFTALVGAFAWGATVIGGATRVLVSVSGNPAVMRMDGTAPTAAIGHVLPVGYNQVWEGEWLRQAKWINQAGVAVLSVQLLN